jgi:hypothetical protein
MLEAVMAWIGRLTADVHVWSCRDRHCWLCSEWDIEQSGHWLEHSYDRCEALWEARWLDDDVARFTKER